MIDQFDELLIIDSCWDDYMEEDDAERLNTFIEQVLESNLEDNLGIKEAFYFLVYIYAELNKLDTEINISLYEINENINIQWRILLDKENPHDKSKMFSQLSELIVSTDVESEIIETWTKCFPETIFLDKKIEIIQRILDTDAELWLHDYIVDTWIPIFLQTMIDNNTPKITIESKIVEYWKYSCTREFVLNQCLQNNDIELAISILIESIHLDHEYSGLVENHRGVLKNIYLQKNMHREYQEQLIFLLIDTPHNPNINYFKELKQTVPNEQWYQFLTSLLELFPPINNLSVIYAHEKMYDQLISTLCQRAGLYHMQEYEDLLVEKYEEQILQKYVHELNIKTHVASDRNTYRDCVSVLRHMKKFPNGLVTILNLKKNWQEQYSRRSAMMDELNKL